MHVLAATNNLHPDEGATGSGRYNYEVGRRLVERGHDVSIVTRRRGAAPDEETIDGMDVYRYDASMTGLRGALRSIERIVDDVAEAKPVDVASFHGALSSLGADRALPAGVPRTYTVHGLWGVEYRDRLVDPNRMAAPWHWLNRFVRHRIEGHVLGHCDSIVVLSEFMRERVEEQHAPSAPVTVVPGGVDVDRFAPDGTHANDIDGTHGSVTDETHAGDDGVDDASGDVFPTAGPNVLTVRRLTPRMGLETLLDAFARVLEGEEDPHLYVGGDGPLRPDLEARAARLGIDSAVTFLGYVPEERLPATYAAADLFVLPTLELEGFGLVTLEALAAGTPVIGTAAGATPELLGDLERADGIPANLLVPPGDDVALGRAIAEWTERSPDERRMAGTVCRSSVRDAGYSWADVTDRLVAHFGGLRSGETGEE